MTKADIMKIALDLAAVLVDAGAEIEDILNSPKTETLIEDIEQLISDIKANA